MDNEAISNYQPGQYTTLGLPKPGDETGKKFVKRAYSLCSSPDQTGDLEFFIATVDGGELTPRLSELESGSRVLCGPKITGTFTVGEIPPQSHLVLVATGTGLAPYVSMIRTKSFWQSFSDVVIINGVRHEKDLAYNEEIEAIKVDHPGLRFLTTVTRPEGQWSGNVGRIQKLFLGRVVEIDPKRSHVFLCGNPAMIEEAKLLLETFGLNEHTKKQAGNIHIEKYW